MVHHAWERVRPPSWVEVRLPSVSPGCGTPRPHGTRLPVPSLGVGLGKVEGCSSATLAMPTTGGNSPVNSLHADLPTGSARAREGENMLSWLKRVAVFERPLGLGPNCVARDPKQDNPSLA